MAIRRSARPASQAWTARAAVVSIQLWLACAGCVSKPFVGEMAVRFARCDDPRAQEAMVRARELLAEGRDSEAVGQLRAVVEACPDYIDGHVAFQDASRDAGGALELAMRTFYAERTDDQASPLMPYLLSRVYDDDSERLPMLDLALERDRSFGFAYLDKARIMRRLGRTDEALGLLQRAVAADAGSASANLELADVYSELGRGREAAPHYATYITLRPDDNAARRRYLTLLTYSLDRLDEAQAIAGQLLQDDPDDVVIIMDLAAIAWQRGDTDEARRNYHEVLRLDPLRDRAVLNLGNLYYETLAGSTESDRRAWWPKARAAYTYFLSMRRAAGLFDLLDFHVFVPDRLATIESLLGPAPADFAPTPADF